MANNQAFKLNSGLAVTSVFEIATPVTEESYVFNGPWPTLTDTTSFTIPSAYVGASGNKGLFFKPDGLQMYFISNDLFGGEAFIYQFTLSTAWDVTTASYTAVSGDNIDSGNYLGETEGLKFSPDGTKAYVFSYISQLMVQYPLTTPWDISTLSNSTRVEINWPTVVGAGFNVQGGTFIDGGKRLILSHTSVPTSSPDFYEITLSEPYNIATAAYYSITYDYAGANNNAGPWTDFAFNSTGTIAVGVNSTKTSDFSFLRTDPNSPWDLSTLTQNPPSGGSWSPRFNITGIANPEGIFIHPDNTKVFVIDGTSDKIHELATNTSTSTWDTDFRNYKLDLSQGNYFTKLLTNNTRLEFDNPPPDGQIGSFIMEITGNSEGYDLSNFTFEETFPRLLQLNNPTSLRDIYVSPDGHYLYYMDSGLNRINSRYLETAFDFGSYNSRFDKAKSLTTEDSSMRAFTFKPDGTQFFIAGIANDSVYVYDLSTPWDLNTAVYDSSKTFSYNPTLNGDITSLKFKYDGTKMYLLDVTGFSNDKLVEFDLSTAWNPSTASASGNTFNLDSPTQVSRYLQNGTFSPDGSEYFVMEGYPNNTSPSNLHTIHKFTLSTPWDVSTMSWDSEVGGGSGGLGFYISGLDEPHNFIIKPDGKKIFVFGFVSTDSTSNHSFTIEPSSTPDDFYISWPDNIRWNKGLVPETPATGETDQYAFITTDGGKTYYGKVLGDNI